MVARVSDPLKVVLAVVFPPLGVFCEVGLTGHFWLNLVLTLLGYVPGVIHALYVMLSPDPQHGPFPPSSA
jgi:uncharacterized membrane protein YqaE (UPF0057 family)